MCSACPVPCVRVPCHRRYKESGLEDEHYCAYPEEQRSARTYTHYDLRLQSGSTAIADWQVVCPQADNYLWSCSWRVV